MRRLLNAIGLPHLVSPYLLLTLTALFWASNVVLGRAVAGRIPPITLNSLRWAIALAIMAPVALGQLRGKAHLVREWLVPLVILAIPTVAIYNSFIYLGTHTTTAANAGLIVGTASIAGENKIVTVYHGRDSLLATAQRAGLALAHEQRLWIDQPTAVKVFGSDSVKCLPKDPIYWMLVLKRNVVCDRDLSARLDSARAAQVTLNQG